MRTFTEESENTRLTVDEDKTEFLILKQKSYYNENTLAWIVWILKE